MEEFVIQTVVFTPIAQYLIKPHRPWNRIYRHLGTFISFTFVLVISTYFTLKSISQPNLFKILNAKPWYNNLQIRQCYLKASLKLHPDRNKAEDAMGQFEAMQRSYEILRYVEQRRMYNRYGDIIYDFYIKMNEEPLDKFRVYEKLPFGDIIYVSIIQCIISLLFAYIYTLGNKTTNSRNIALMYSILMCALEFYLRFDKDSDSFMANVPLICNCTTYEKILLSRRSSSMVLNVLVIIQESKTDFDLRCFAFKRLERYLNLVDRLDQIIYEKYRNLHGVNPPWASVIYPIEKDDQPWAVNDDVSLKWREALIKYYNDSDIVKHVGVPSWSKKKGSLLRELLNKLDVNKDIKN
ncbi:DnaJ protein, putative [Babesia microti strain RI]|uniref:DnaJ protein, putative n=1 Tax=Babesia microti (strain RI) TaxID=1133968 RepID=A0A1R4ABQ4_BABMR|nr:DnaJ protein, putative [Babesia microti strain RI]SJK86442.1 DnaJ protein, putative [Babesia microti strain RI]|eukprot:XP_021338599.1 DnaJ protein, putative [Babesia microti strain RI]